jgi:hypothetical protein
MSYDDDMGHDADVDIGFDSGAFDDNVVSAASQLANIQSIPPTQKAPQDESIPGDRFGGFDEISDEDPGFFSGIGTLFTKGFDALGSFVDYTLTNPISSVVNTAINYSPPGLAANVISMATTGRSLAGHMSDQIGVPADVSPAATATQGVAQDIASSLGGLFGGPPDPSAMPDEEMPGYMQNYAQGGLASLPQISNSGLYRAMGRG